MLNVIHQFETSTVLFFVTVCFVAGFIKGIVGFAMPMIILGCSAALGMPLLGHLPSKFVWKSRAR